MTSSAASARGPRRPSRRRRRKPRRTGGRPNRKRRIPIDQENRKQVDATIEPPDPILATLGRRSIFGEQGRSFTRAGFGNWFRDKCDAAGLPQCTAHGLRKAIVRRMVELNQGNQTMKAVSGHRKDEEVARYTEAANQRSMADDAIGVLARWEMSNRAERLDTDAAETR